MIKAWDVEKNADKVLSIFLTEQNNLSDERSWELMRTVWILSGKIENVAVFKKLMSSPRQQRFYFSTPEEAKKMRELPGKVSVYRACNTLDDGGISWTLSKEYAEWYQKTYNKKELFARIINKNEIFAYINRNKEEEVIIFT